MQTQGGRDGSTATQKLSAEQGRLDLHQQTPEALLTRRGGLTHPRKCVNSYIRELIVTASNRKSKSTANTSISVTTSLPGSFPTRTEPADGRARLRRIRPPDTPAQGRHPHPGSRPSWRRSTFRGPLPLPDEASSASGAAPTDWTLQLLRCGVFDFPIRVAPSY